MEGTTQHKNTLWTVAEVETLLSVVAEDRIQKEPTASPVYVSRG